MDSEEGALSERPYRSFPMGCACLSARTPALPAKDATADTTHPTTTHQIINNITVFPVCSRLRYEELVCLHIKVIVVF